MSVENVVNDYYKIFNILYKNFNNNKNLLEICNKILFYEDDEKNKEFVLKIENIINNNKKILFIFIINQTSLYSLFNTENLDNVIIKLKKDSIIKINPIIETIIKKFDIDTIKNICDHIINNYNENILLMFEDTKIIEFIKKNDEKKYNDYLYDIINKKKDLNKKYLYFLLFCFQQKYIKPEEIKKLYFYLYEELKKIEQNDFENNIYSNIIKNFVIKMFLFNIICLYNVEFLDKSIIKKKSRIKKIAMKYSNNYFYLL